MENGKWEMAKMLRFFPFSIDHLPFRMRFSASC
jgi:hypothetical protein